MTKPEEFDPEVVATLDAIDATLAGEAVDPRHAEIAELALLLADERPRVDAAFATVLDEGVQRRFERPSRAARRRFAWSVWAPSAAVAASLIVAVVIVASQSGGGSSTNSTESGSAGVAAAAASAPNEHHHGAAQKLVPAAQGTLDKTFSLPSRTSTTGSSSASTAAVPRAPAVPQGLNTPALTPFNGPSTAGRKVVQGARLSLSTTSKRVDQVAQEVFNVIAQQKGIVKSSQVTANGGPGGNAEFQLSVPNGNLAATMAALSDLQYAHVASRTDSSQDVTNQFRVDQRRLADDRALRTALLKQLASAVTQAEIDSLNARIHDAAAAISSDENALHAINRSVGYSQIYVEINAGFVPVAVHKGGGGFTVGKAAHDAGHVLTVAAGVALIGLAGLLPLALVLALVWWIYATLRRRSRLQALDQI
ncbi:MAG TPA: DUF4349 domain-containing protein [Solirubrobacteraceae bacterium]|jgi:hypothetical protein